MSKKINVREIGSYEVVLCDKKLKRKEEIVFNGSLVDARHLARKTLRKTKKYKSFYISKIVDNSKYKVWSPK
jgi:hypothetical protein